MAIQQVASGIFAADHRVADGKNGIVLGTRGALAVDVGTYPEEGQAMADFIVHSGYDPDRVILTHGHGDHILGGAAFAGSEVYAHEKTPEVCRRFLVKLAERKGQPYDQLAAGVLWPTVMFSDALYIDLGDKHIRLFRTPGHSEDGISVYVEEDRVLVAGDSVVTGIIPAIGDGDSRVLERTLGDLLSRDIEILIPGHGAVVHGTAAVQDALRWARGYLSDVRAASAEAIVGGLRDPESIADGIRYGDFVGDRLPVDQHSMANRHRSTVLKIIEEELTQDA